MRRSHIKTVRTRLADGTIRVYQYDRKTGARIGAPASEQRQPGDRFAANSLGHAVALFEKSHQYAALQPGSRRVYQRAFRLLDPLLHMPAADVKRRHIRELRDAVAASAGPGAANNFVSAVRSLFAWLLDLWDLDVNPAAGIKPFGLNHLPSWTEEQADAAAAGFPEHLRRAVVLAYHLGQRRGDLTRLTWSQYDGEVIHLRQQKTGKELWLPVTPDLRQELATWRASTTSTHILTDAQGLPWRAGSSLSSAIARAVVAAGLPAGLNLHGLRKLMCRRLKLSGASVPEIAAVSGHENWELVKMYAEGADQRALATAAVTRLSPQNKARTG